MEALFELLYWGTHHRFSQYLYLNVYNMCVFVCGVCVYCRVRVINKDHTIWQQEDHPIRKWEWNEIIKNTREILGLVYVYVCVDAYRVYRDIILSWENFKNIFVDIIYSNSKPSGNSERSKTTMGGKKLLAHQCILYMQNVHTIMHGLISL